MAQRSSFAEIKAEQARMTESWKAEGRTSEAWAVADPEIVEIFSSGIAFGLKVAARKAVKAAQRTARRQKRGRGLPR